MSQIDGLEANTNQLARLGADRVNDDVCPEARAIFPNSPTFGFENTFAPLFPARDEGDGGGGTLVFGLFQSLEI